MSTSRSLKEALKQRFRVSLNKKSDFSTQELKAILKEYMPLSKDSTISWWIHVLAKDQFFHKIHRGCYSFFKLPDFAPTLSLKAQKLYDTIKSSMPADANICILESIWILEIMDMDPTRHYIFVQIDKYYQERLFFELQNAGCRVFLTPGDKVIEKYVMPLKEAVMIYPVFKSMPIKKYKTYDCHSIESLLIHSYLYGKKYFHLTDKKIDYLFIKALEKYNVNIRGLLRYAARRNIKEPVLAVFERNGLQSL